jgi:crotonobetainyl-CoA:carnitine CoA-transferase CaiB-like acyl-CoA transferase
MNNDYELFAACVPDPQAERAHVARLLPGGTEPAAEQAAERPVARAPEGRRHRCAVLAWAGSGLMYLTGPKDGPPLAPAAPILARASAVAATIADLTARDGDPVLVDVNHVLAVRASLARWKRSGQVSANGSCRLLRAADGWLAINLARPADAASVPALLGREFSGPPWPALRAEAAIRPAAELAAQAQLLGIPASALDGVVTPSGAPVPPVRYTRHGQAGQSERLVLNLSALWAGPLCGHILARAGWRVITVEDSRRPDPTRTAWPAFHADLHNHGPAIILDFGSTPGRAALARIADQADVVIEASRPRALAGLGLMPAQWLAARAGRVWVSITGYGRDDPAQRVAFGDDAAIAGGLVAVAPDLTPVFCGDAIADPLSGLTAALAVLAAAQAGGGLLADVAMSGVCADVARPASGPLFAHPIRQRTSGADDWTVGHEQVTEPVAAPC